MLTLFLALQTAGSPVAGSTPITNPAAPIACEITDVRTDEAKQAAPQGPFDLYVICDDKAVSLGSAVRYASSYNAALHSTVVVVRDGRRSRVAFVSPGGDGNLHLDDVSRELAKLSGRYVGAGIGSMPVDLSQFALHGSVAVPVAAHDGQPATTASLDLTGYAAFTAALKPIPVAPTSPITTQPNSGG